jgi:hypothetical protein
VGGYDRVECCFLRCLWDDGVETGVGVKDIWEGFAGCCVHREISGYMLHAWLDLDRATFEDKKRITGKEY